MIFLDILNKKGKRRCRKALTFVEDKKGSSFILSLSAQQKEKRDDINKYHCLLLIGNCNIFTVGKVLIKYFIHVS